jgi:hypothetical protein
MNDRPIFNDPALQAAWDEAAPTIKGHSKKLDTISHDIRQLEHVLRTGCVPPATFETSKGLFRWDSQRILFALPGQQPKPLIEHKAAVRLDTHGYLAGFLEYAGRSKR